MKDTTPPTFTTEELKVPELSRLRHTSPASVEKSRFAPFILGGLIVLLSLILVGLYFWYDLITRTPVVPSVSARPTAEQNQEPESTTARAQTQALEVMSISDELEAIEADLEGTNLETLEAELNAINAELNAAAVGQP